MRLRTRSSIVAIAAISLSICLSGTSLAARGWTGPTALTNDGVTHLLSLHSLASDGHRLHLFYPRSDFVGTTDKLLYRRSLDGGLTWEPERVLFASGPRLTEAVANLSIAARGDLVVVAFRSHDAKSAVLFTRSSHDGGTTWGPRVRIDRVQTNLKMGISNVVISDAGIVVAWSVRSTGRISTSLSTDGGETFSPPRQLATTAFSFVCGNPDFRDGLVGLAADGLAVDLAWSDSPNSVCGADRLFLRRSTDGGRTWKPRQLLPDNGVGTLGWPEIAVHGKAVLLLVSPQGSGQLLLHSDDGGLTFGARLLDPDTTTSAGDVAFAPDGKAMVTVPEVTIAADGTGFASSRLVTLSSSDGGSTWSRPRVAQVTSGVGGVGTPNLAFTATTPTIAFNIIASDFSGSDVFVTVGTGFRSLLGPGQ
jgi:hypothetical protein